MVFGCFVVKEKANTPVVSNKEGEGGIFVLLRVLYFVNFHIVFYRHLGRAC